MDSLSEMIEQCQRDSLEWFGEEIAANLTMYVFGLAGETGEVLDEFKKVFRGSQSMEDAEVKIATELVDVLIYICNIAGLMRLDIGAIYDAKRKFNAGRFGTAESDAGVRNGSLHAVEEGS